MAAEGEPWPCLPAPGKAITRGGSPLPRQPWRAQYDSNLPAAPVGPVTPAALDRLQRALPALALAALVGLAVLGWWLFPVLQGYVAFQDCAASGRTDCAPHPAPGS